MKAVDMSTSLPIMETYGKSRLDLHNMTASTVFPLLNPCKLHIPYYSCKQLARGEAEVYL